MHEIEETTGARIARLRQERGWTQQTLADRVAVSRVAISHIEMDLSTPSERTITLIAGLFKMEPRGLVAGTSYPRAKAERLPFVACCYTALELELALLARDIEWLQRLQGSPHWLQLVEALRQDWTPTLDALRQAAVDPEERQRVARAQRTLRAACAHSQVPVLPDN